MESPPINKQSDLKKDMKKAAEAFKTETPKKKSYVKPRFALTNEAVPTKGQQPSCALTEINATDRNDFEFIIGNTFINNEFKEFHNVNKPTTIVITACKGMSEKLAVSGVPIINVFANYGPDTLTICSDDIGGPGPIKIKPGKSKQITIYPLKDGSFRLY